MNTPRTDFAFDGFAQEVMTGAPGDIVDLREKMRKLETDLTASQAEVARLTRELGAAFVTVDETPDHEIHPHTPCLRGAAGVRPARAVKRISACEPKIEEQGKEWVRQCDRVEALETELANTQTQLQLAKVENNHNWQFQSIHEETLKENAALREVMGTIIAAGNDLVSVIRFNNEHRTWDRAVESAVAVLNR